MAFLVRPSATYKTSFIEAIREFQAEGLHTGMNVNWLERHFADFVRQLDDRLDRPKPDRVPELYLWLVDDGEFIGRVSVRHRLNDSLLNFGGHISYEIRPSKRRRGYGTLILKLALDQARELGLQRVLITCDDNNTGSYKIIEANGGRLENKVQNAGRSVKTRRYWIEIE